MTYRVGQQLGNYRILRSLGRGAFAEVYLGEHLYLKRYAALKVLHTSLEDQDVERFLAEGQTLARLTHPNIVRVLEFFVEQGTPILVMDLAPGGTLRQHHPGGSYLSLETTVAYVKQVASALQYAHNRNVIHRDIKPENMLLGVDRQIMLSDFGLALFSPSSQLLSTQEMSGTIPYMAPEQLRGKPTFASDQYALAVVVYEWLCGVRPFEGSYWAIAQQHISGQPPRLREKDPSLPEAVESVVLKALSKNPQQRYASVQMFANALERASQVSQVRERIALDEVQITSPLEAVLRSRSGIPKRIFLSASPADAAFVARLKDDLKRRGMSIWDASKEGGQNIPDDGGELVRQAIRAADVMLVVASPQARSSRAVKAHLRIADMYKRQLVIVWVEGNDVMEALPLMEEKATLIDARQRRYDVALNEIVVLLDRQSSAPVEPMLPEPVGEPRNPYKGLRAFTQNDAGDFFGRDGLLQELVDMLKEILASEKLDIPGSRLLTVIGPSGSGKSSAVMAGLLPRLQRGALSGSDAWVYLPPMVPGTQPIEALALTLSAYLPNRSLKSIREDLAEDSARGLHLLAAYLSKEPKQKVVLLIDQFEELFNLTTSEKERQHFIDLLVAAATEPRGPVILLLTLRADFYDRPLPYRELGQLILRNQSVVLPMEMHELRAAIRQPATLPDVQLTFEGNLVGDLLFEVQGQPGALPLLQFALDQLFERRQNHVLTVQAYQEIGGVKGALAKQAEVTYLALPSEAHRKMARSLFLRLIDPGLTEQDTTRRRAALAELSLPSPQETELLQQVTAYFLAARLLTTNEIAGIPTIEVSHEALIREWTRLNDWLWEAREDIHLQQIISKDVAEWQQRGRPKDRLYRGSQLKEAREWARHNTPSKDETLFLHTSSARSTRYHVGTVAILLLVLLLSIPAFVLVQPYFSASVTNLNDNGPGSLLQAVATASAGSTITFDSSLRGSIVLTSGDLVISRNLTIRGPGARILSIVGGKHGTHKLNVLAGVTATISGLTFSSLNDSGIKNSGNLTLIDTTVSGNTTPGNGAGIENYDGGWLTLIHSRVLGNTVESDYTSFAKNKDFGNGGGIANHNILKISDSIISDNTASGDGGGIQNDYNSQDAVTIINSVISGNKACRGGGGIFNRRGGITLRFTTVSGNKVGNCVGYTFGPIGVGGGIKNFGALTLANSTISGNITPINGGGIYSGIYNTDIGSLTLSNSTISGNMAANNGGGIDNDGAQATITFCTTYGNTAHIGGGISIENNIHNTFGLVVAIRNSIVAGNHASTAGDISGNLTSNGYNLIQDTSGAIFASNQHLPDISGDQFTNLGIDPKLQNNGGLTWSHKLLPGSPAIDKIPPEACRVDNNFPSDQRDVQRPQGSACDIGAYEYALSR